MCTSIPDFRLSSFCIPTLQKTRRLSNEIECFGVAQAGNESLAGVNKDDMLKKLLDFKTGKKPATIMHQLSKGYSDEQLAALATYFSALKK